MKFGTDGVRGRAYTELTLRDAARLGSAVAEVFATDEVVVGRDTRESGPEFVTALASGLAHQGASLLDLGIVPTPEVAFMAKRLNQPAIVVSASHNKWQDNGLKVFAPGGAKLSDEQQLAIETVLASDESLTAAHDRFQMDIRDVGPESTDAYLDHIVDTIDGRDLTGLTIVIDCANGAAVHTAPRLFEMLGAAVEVLHNEPDGQNINQDCGSTHMDALQAAVAAGQADLGLALDGDADRVLAVDDSGSIVDGDAIIAIAAIDMASAGSLADNTVVATVMSNLGFHRAMAANGIDVHITPVGDRHVLDALGRKNLSLGGEQSGHVIVSEHTTTGDGLLTGVLLSDIVKRSGRSLGVLASVVEPVPQILENVAVHGSSAAIADALAETVTQAEADLGEGGRILVRASGTEPLLRIMVEADDHKVAETIVASLVDAAHAHDQHE